MFPLRKNIKIRFLFFLSADAILIALSVFFAFLLRFDGQIPFQYFQNGNILAIIILSLFFCVPIFYFFRLYSFSWSYVSSNELISLFKAVALVFFFLIVVFLLFDGQQFLQGFPRSVIIISCFLIFVFCGGIRLSKRIWISLFRTESKGLAERVLIVGAGDAGEQILRNIINSKDNLFLPVGFVDDNPVKIGVAIHGIKVLGKISDIFEVVKSNGVKQLIIALPSAGSGAIKMAVELGRKAGLQNIKIIPTLNEIIDGQITINDLRQVQVEDLLGREPVDLDKKLTEDFIRNKKVLITGAAGSIGSELARQIAKFDPSGLLLLDQDETGIFNISEEIKNKFPQLRISSLVADICEEKKIKIIFNRHRPNIVFHAAAYKHVPLMEEQPDEAVRNNILGVRITAESAMESGVEKFIFISTDKAVNPSSIMGATKRIGEIICKALNQKNNTKFISVRFGNVLGSRGSVVPTFREQIKRGGPVEVTHPEMKRYFMLIPEACLLVMQAGAMGKGGEVFVLDMGKPIKIYDLAREMISLSGLEPDKDIPIIFTKPRPGEKLFEEMLSAEEGTTATQNQKILIARLSGAIDEKELNRNLENLNNVAEQGNKEEIKKILKTIAPSYEPNNI
jgi:FlaA1/EpsC-like NDP-sugar epimerase